MAVYQFSALSDGQAISFNPSADVLQFDQSSIAAAEVRALIEGANLRLRYAETGKDVVLLNTAPAQITIGNVTFADGSRLLFGSDSGNSLLGTSAGDHLWGLGGNDTLNGGSGDDWLAGGTGQDNLTGGTGADAYAFLDTPFNNNYDRVHGFVSGTDSIWLHEEPFGGVGALGRFSAGDARFHAAAGATSGHDADDRIIYNTSNGYLFYDADGSGAGKAMFIGVLQGAPTLVASDIVLFGDGEVPPPPGDTVVTHERYFTLPEGIANVTVRDPLEPPGFSDGNIVGNAMNNVIRDETSADTFMWLDGAAGDDTLFGGAGPDMFVFYASAAYGDDSVEGGTGYDRLWVGSESAVDVDFRVGTVSGGGTGGSGSVRFADIEEAIGGSFDDRLTADDAGRTLMGGDGNDTLTGGAGNDEIWGEGGFELWAGDGDDLIFGGAGDDTLLGNDGNDTLYGGPGRDLINLAFANPLSDEEIGSDTVVFAEAPDSASADDIVGFQPGIDKLAFNNETHANLGAAGAFAANDARFFAGPGANAGQDPSDRIVYNTSTGQLWYDADGSGSGAAQLIATLQGAPALAAEDIVVYGDGGPGPITGTSGDDSLLGTGGNDTIDGLGGNDTIDGRGGSDSLVGGSGDDLIIGGMFDPFVAEGGDVIVGGEGNDTLNGRNSVFAGEDLNVDTMDGGLGDDYYVVDGDDVLIDAGGVDTVEAKHRDWTLGGGFENLILNTDETEGPQIGVGNGLDNFMRVTWTGRLEGRDGDDTLIGGASFRLSELYGEGGDDVLDGAFGDTLDGGAGNDTLSGGWTMTGGSGADRFELADQVSVTDFASGLDKLRLNGESLSGVGPSGNFAAGDERFHAAPGATGAHDASDRLIYNTTTGDLYYDPDGTGSAAQTFVAKLEGAPSLLATDIEVVNGTASGSVINGTAGNDSMLGTGSNDTMVGFAGNDTLNGAGGDDWLEGGPGQDQLTGGTGADSFVFRDTPFNNNYDRVHGFASGSDEVVLDRVAYGDIGATGEFAAGDGRFYAAAGATSGHDADDRLIYNTSNGYLFYDADGSGAGKAMFVGILQGAPALEASDISVI